MNKRDIIIIAVLLNTGLLSMLAMMAIHTDESFEEPQESSIIAYENRGAMLAKDPVLMVQHPSVATDEWDNVLKDYVLASSSQNQIAEEEEFEKEAESPKKIVKEAPVAPQKPVAVEKASTKVSAPAIEKPVILTQNTKVGKTIEVTVKKGDVLEKIAKANGTTTEQIKALNNLKSDRLAVGQQLKIAVDGDKIAKVVAPVPVQQVQPVQATEEVEYYVLKSGDNPWKIAKQFKVKFEDLLKMNQLDEEKARNLKIGDRIRVK